MRRPRLKTFWLTLARRAKGRGARPVAGPQAATDPDRRMMSRAIALAARAARLGEVPVGAIVYETATGTVLGKAHNRRETDRDPTSHAELAAIKAAAEKQGDWRLNSCTLVVTLEPCAMCAGLIVNARVGRLVYGADDPRAGAVRTLYSITSDPRLNHRPEIVAGLEAERCGRMLTEFFRARREARKRSPKSAN